MLLDPRRTPRTALLVVTLLLCSNPSRAQAVTVVDAFHTVPLTGRYYSESADVGDFNRDGALDVVSGPYWYEGPAFTNRHTIFQPVAFPVSAFASQFFVFTIDVDRDGWDDVLTIGFPGTSAYWFANPKSTTARWTRHKVGDMIGNESPRLLDLVGNARVELVCFSAGRVGYFAPDPNGATRPWIFHPISSITGVPPFIHGLGVGDLNGDGRKDFITAYGWFEQPSTPSGNWPFRPAGLGFLAGGSQIEAYDVDGDGDNDVVTSLNAHGYGLSWFENTIISGSRVFLEHIILPPHNGASSPVQFSQLHSLAMADMDGDGLKDIITGKTYKAHNGSDPGSNDPPVVYWFRLQRGASVRFEPKFVSDQTGVGRRIVVRDVDGDGKPDVVVGNKLGAAILIQG